MRIVPTMMHDLGFDLYVRYAAAGIAGLLLAPFLFVRCGLAGRRDPSLPGAREGAFR